MLSTKKLATTEICKLLFALTPFLPPPLRTSEEVGTERYEWIRNGHTYYVCDIKIMAYTYNAFQNS